MKQYIYDGTKYVLHEDVVGLSELPTASAKYLDKVYLLTAVQTGYEKGAIYECHEVTPATDPKTYEWVKVTTDGGSMYKVYSGNYDSVEGEFYDADGNALPKVDKQQYYDIATRTTWIYYSAWSGFFRLFNDVVGMESSQMLSPLMTEYYPELNATHFRCMNVSGNDGGLIEGFIYKLDRMSVTPEAGDSPVDKGWWEVDSTTGKMIQTTDTEVVSSKLYFKYVWTQVKPQQSVFPGTLDEWDALTPAEQAKYDFVASPEEADKEPVIPRFVSLLSRGISATGSVSLDSGKKFSDYQAIKFEVASREGSSSYEYIYRGSIELPIDDIQMGSSRTVLVQYNVAGNYYYMAIQITSDTTINVTHVNDSLSSQYTRILRIYGEL